MKKLLKILTTIAAVLTTAILFTTCKQFRDDPEDFLSYWAAEVVPRGFDIDKPTQKIGGIEYIPSYCDGAFSDVTVTIKLHNPKKFSLVMPSPTSSPSDVQKIIRFPGLSLQPAYGTDYTLEQTPDKAALKLTYKPGFLKAHEWSNGGIGPEITFISTDGRKFGKKFSLNLKADTAPPKPSVTLAQTKIGQKYYVLCLRVPDMDKTVTGDKLHKDMTHIEINGTKYELKINGGGTDFIKPADLAFIEASKVEKLPIPGAANPPTGAWVLYYQTDIKVEYGAEKNYTITLIDEQGLVSEELKPTAKAEFPVFYVRGTNGDWYNSVPDAAEGDDTTGNGSKEKPYATVTKALTQCTENGVPYIILTDGTIEENDTLNIESGKMITIASLRKDTPAIIHDKRPNPSDSSPPPPRYLITTAGTLTLDSVILEADITATHGDGSNKYVYGIQQTSGTVTVTGKTEIKNFAHAVEITGGTFTMEDGSICNNYVNGDEAGVNISGGTFVLNGGSIKDNEATNNVGVSISSGTFTMTGGEISGNRAYCFGGGISAYGGTVEISGGTINNNHAAKGPSYQSGSTVDVGGGGIYINGGTVNFKGGTIKDNFLDGADKNCGAGVFVEGGGTFNMTGGTIEGCKPDPNAYNPESSKGGGVFVKDGTFTMSGGTVSGNTANAGGGVFVQKGTFTMSGGKVSGNTADKGGGIYGENSAYDRGVITISDSEVSGNTATSNGYAGGGIYSRYKLTVSGSAQIKDNNAPNGSGGGIAIRHVGIFDFTGGTVSGNTAKQGSGIYVEDPPGTTKPMKMSGSATVTKDNDVFLDSQSFAKAFITVTKALSSPHAARLTMKDGNYGYYEDRVVVEGTSDFALTLDYVNKFPITPQQTSSGLKNWKTVLDGNELKLKEP